MRCPKCGSFTFDHLEVCTKCNKNIAKASDKLSGTIYQAESPPYLQFEMSEPEMDESGSVDVLDDEGFETETFADEDDDGIVMSFDEEDEGGEIDFSEDEEIEFDFSSDEEAAEDEVELDLAGDEDEEFDLGLSEGSDEDALAGLDLDFGDDKQAGGKGGEEPSVDFGDLDISDLAPPSESVGSSPVEDLAMKDEDPTEAEIAEAAAEEKAVADTLGLSGLADLSMDGLDLDVASSAPAGSVTGDKMKPAAKTGTALDDFDIDLGDLMSGMKK